VGIPDYVETSNEIVAAGAQPYEHMKVGWIGARTHANRNLMLDIGNAHPDMFDFMDMNWIKTETQILDSTRYMSIPDMVKKYAILIDVEGKGWSARLKYLLWSRRPVILVERPHKEYFHEHLVEWKHYVPVKRDMSDLVEKTQWIIDNYDKALEIAENAYLFSQQHLTREACYARWNEIITEQ
jgi:hypothetical protein